MCNYRILTWALLLLVACAPTEQLPKKQMLLSKPIYVHHHGNAVYAISQEDGTAEIVIPAEKQVRAFAVVSNGDVAYSTAEGDLYIFDGETHTLLYDGLEEENVYGIAWSPDMTWLAYCIGHDDPPRHSQQSHGAWLYRFESGEYTHLDLNVYNQYMDENDVIQHDFDVERHIYTAPKWSPDSKTVTFSARKWEGWGLTWFNLDDPKQPEKLSIDGYSNPTRPSVKEWTADSSQMLVSETIPGLVSGAYLIGRADGEIVPLVDVDDPDAPYMLWSLGIDDESGAYLASGSILNEDHEYGKLTLYELEGKNELTAIMTHSIRCPEGSGTTVGDLRDAPLSEGIMWCGNEAYWLHESGAPLTPLTGLNGLFDELTEQYSYSVDWRRKYTIVVGE